MPCYRPVTAWKPDDGGSISFRELKNHREIKIPCGRCIGCRIEIVDAWAFRCMAEAAMHKNNHFITLTYDDEHLPVDEQLDHRHWQLFAKRLRERVGPFRFFMCGEYGENTFRPHYHALLFGCDLPDLVKCNSVYAKCDVYTSEVLQDCWKLGHHTIGTVTHESARYCAGYATKRVSEELAAERYTWVTRFGEVLVRRQPYGKMSLRPGIGAEWFEKYYKDSVNHGAVFVNQYRKRVPRYFVDLLEDINPTLREQFDGERTKAALAALDPNEFSRERLEAKEKCALAAQKFKKERFSDAL